MCENNTSITACQPMRWPPSAIVLAAVNNEQDRQVEDAGPVDAFQEGPAIGRAVAEETDRHLVAAQQLHPMGGAGGAAKEAIQPTMAISTTAMETSRTPPSVNTSFAPNIWPNKMARNVAP